MKKTTIYKIFAILFVFAGSLFSGVAVAGCAIEDGTFYAKKKLDMTAFAIYMDQGKQDDALRMVDDERIKASSQASVVVLERDGHFVHAQITGIGKVWIYDSFLYCE